MTMDAPKTIYLAKEDGAADYAWSDQRHADVDVAYVRADPDAMRVLGQAGRLRGLISDLAACKNAKAQTVVPIGTALKERDTWSALRTEMET